MNWRELRADDLLRYWRGQTIPGRDRRLLAQLLDDGYRSTQVLEALLRWQEDERTPNLYAFCSEFDGYSCADMIEAETELARRLMQLQLMEAREMPTQYLVYLDYRDGAGGNATLERVWSEATVYMEGWCDKAMGSAAGIGGARSVGGAPQRRRLSPAAMARLRALD